MHSILIVTLAYKRPDLYYLQLQMLHRYLDDFYCIAITSKSNEEKINEIFEKTNTNGHITITNKEKGHTYTYEIVNEALKYFQKSDYDWIIYLDDDVIPINKFTIRNQARYYDNKLCQFIMWDKKGELPEVETYREGLAEIIDYDWYHWDKASGYLTKEKEEADYERYIHFINNYDLKDIGYMRHSITFRHKGDFFDSEVCKSLLHCNACRCLKHWRKEIANRWEVDNIDWKCPHGWSGYIDGVARRDGKGQIWMDANTG